MVEQEPESGLREVVHQRVRLGILAVVDRRGPCTFPQLRDALGQSDGALSRHLGVLEEHGYISIEKVFENKRPRTWVRLTPAGDDAFREEQELLATLLARAGGRAPADATATGERDERTADLAIVFAALLAGEDDRTGEEVGDGDRVTADRTDRTDRAALVPGVVVLAGRRARQLASGPVSARYEFPTDYGDVGFEQREQRLMLLSHGLRGGWITTWDLGPEADVEQGDADGRRGITAHVMVVELGAAADCAAILAIMGAPTVDLPDVPAARAYLLPGVDDASPATSVAWLSAGPHLACVVVLAVAEDSAPVLEHLVAEVHRTLSEHHA